MAITAANWSRRVEIVDANVSPTLTGYVALLAESNLPSEIWSTAINGGGDLRACLNSDGSSQLPLEVVEFDTVGQKAQLWVRFPTFASGDSLWLFYGKSGETQPQITDTYGRNSVWVDYELVSHDGVTDSTGNHTWNASHIPKVPDQNGRLSSALQFNSSEAAIAITIPSTPPLQPQTLRTWFKHKSGGGTYKTILGIRRPHRAALSVSHPTRAGLFCYGNGFYNELTTSAGKLPENEWKYLVGTVSESERTLRVNHNESFGTNTAALNGFTDGTTFEIGDSGIAGEIANFSWQKSIASDDMLSTEYNNKSNPATFWTTNVPEDTGVSGGVTSSANFTLPRHDVVSTGSVTLPQPTGVASFTLPRHDVASTGSVTLPQPTGVANFTLPRHDVASTGSVTLPQPTGVANFTLPRHDVASTGSVTLPQPTGVANFTLPRHDVASTGSVTLPQPTGVANFTLPRHDVASTGSVTLPQPTGVANFTLPRHDVASTGSVTLPQPTGVANFTLPRHDVASTGSVTGFGFVVDQETHIKQTFLNANSQQVFLSATMKHTFKSNIIKIN